MGNERVEGYAEGFKVGWDKCREEANKGIKLTVTLYPHKHGEELSSEIIEYLDRSEIVDKTDSGGQK